MHVQVDKAGDGLILGREGEGSDWPERGGREGEEDRRGWRIGDGEICVEEGVGGGVGR